MRRRRTSRLKSKFKSHSSLWRTYRQDQAALTVLAHQAGVACRHMHLSVHYHHDDPSDKGTLGGPSLGGRPAAN